MSNPARIPSQTLNPVRAGTSPSPGRAALAPSTPAAGSPAPGRRRFQPKPTVSWLLANDDGIWASATAQQLSREMGLPAGNMGIPAIARNLLRDIRSLCDCMGIDAKCRSRRRTLTEAAHRISRGLTLSAEQDGLYWSEFKRWRTAERRARRSA